MSTRTNYSTDGIVGWFPLDHVVEVAARSKSIIQDERSVGVDTTAIDKKEAARKLTKHLHERPHVDELQGKGLIGTRLCVMIALVLIVLLRPEQHLPSACAEEARTGNDQEEGYPDQLFQSAAGEKI